MTEYVMVPKSTVLEIIDFIQHTEDDEIRYGAGPFLAVLSAAINNPDNRFVRAAEVAELIAFQVAADLRVANVLRQTGRIAEAEAIEAEARPKADAILAERKS